MTTLLLATNNNDKLQELQAILNELPVELVSYDQFPGFPPTVEDADTIEGNAIKKATEALRRTGLPAIADDTGLEVDYLNGRPGVFSSRYAGEDATYADNVRKLLHDLRGVPPRRRGARFRCAVAFVPAQGSHHIVEGICQGTILESPRGANGFGYDPIFLPSGFRQSFAEMDASLKNTISHRALALERIKTVLQQYLSGASG